MSSFEAQMKALGGELRQYELTKAERDRAHTLVSRALQSIKSQRTPDLRGQVAAMLQLAVDRVSSSGVLPTKGLSQALQAAYADEHIGDTPHVDAQSEDSRISASLIVSRDRHLIASFRTSDETLEGHMVYYVLVRPQVPYLRRGSSRLGSVGGGSWEANADLGRFEDVRIGDESGLYFAVWSHGD